MSISAKMRDSYDGSSRVDMLSFIHQPHMQNKMLAADGYVYWINDKDGTCLFYPMGHEEDILEVRLHKPNQPNERFYGKDLVMAARVFLIAYDAIGPAAKQRAKDGKNAFVSYHIDAESGMIKGYVSGYEFDKTKREWSFVHRGPTTGTDIDEGKHKIFDRIKKLKEAKLEAEKAYETNRSEPKSESKD